VTERIKSILQERTQNSQRRYLQFIKLTCCRFRSRMLFQKNTKCLKWDAEIHI